MRYRKRSVFLRSGLGPRLDFHNPATWAVIGRQRLQGETRNDLIDQVSALVFSPDGRRLAVATGDRRIRLCDPVTGRQQTSFVAVDGPPVFGRDTRVQYSYGVESLAFSRDGGWLLSGGPEGTVRLWEVSTRREAQRFTGHEQHVTFVAFGPNGKTILSAGGDGGVYEWDLRPRAAPPVRSVWEDLASSDSAVGYRAAWALIEDADRAVATLRANLAPAVEPKPEELDRLISRLDAPRFADRETAVAELADLGPAVVPALAPRWRSNRRPKPASGCNASWHRRTDHRLRGSCAVCGRFR